MTTEATDHKKPVRFTVPEHESAAWFGLRARARRTLHNDAVVYGILWSCASEAVYEDLVDGPYPSRLAAADEGNRVAIVSGLLFEVMLQVADLDHDGKVIWLNQDGHTARELLDAFREGGLVQMGNLPEPSPRLWRYTS